jgi:hypothetical protein
MDVANPFETPTTFRLHRAEYVVGLCVCSVLIVFHFKDIAWLRFAALFFYIDLFGYLPGAIAFRRSKNHQIHRAYYVIYNTMHSLITQSAAVGLYALLFGWEWALLAIPFHLAGDRGLFGNFLKSFMLPFEPHNTDLGYLRLMAGLGRVAKTEADTELARIAKIDAEYR